MGYNKCLSLLPLPVAIAASALLVSLLFLSASKTASASPIAAGTDYTNSWTPISNYDEYMKQQAAEWSSQFQSQSQQHEPEIQTVSRGSGKNYVEYKTEKPVVIYDSSFDTGSPHINFDGDVYFSESAPSWETDDESSHYNYNNDQSQSQPPSANEMWQ